MSLGDLLGRAQVTRHEVTQPAHLVLQLAPGHVRLQVVLHGERMERLISYVKNTFKQHAFFEFDFIYFECFVHK